MHLTSISKNLKSHQSITTEIPKRIWVVAHSNGGQVQIPNQEAKENQLPTFELRDVWFGMRALIPKLQMTAAHY